MDRYHLAEDRSDGNRRLASRVSREQSQRPKKSRKLIWGRREAFFALRIRMRQEGSARKERGLGHLGRLKCAVDAAFAVFSVFEVRLSGYHAVMQCTDFQ